MSQALPFGRCDHSWEHAQPRLHHLVSFPLLRRHRSFVSFLPFPKNQCVSIWCRSERVFCLLRH